MLYFWYLWLRDKMRLDNHRKILYMKNSFWVLYWSVGQASITIITRESLATVPWQFISSSSYQQVNKHANLLGCDFFIFYSKLWPDAAYFSFIM